MEDKIKKCTICKKDFHKIDFKHIFHRMITCGSKSCKKEYNKLRMREYQNPKKEKIVKHFICKVCEESKIRKNNNQKYCSFKCREFWYANKDTIANVKKKRTKICKICKNKFLAEKISSKTCSNKCSQRYYFLINKEEVIKRNEINYKKRENKRRRKLGLPLIGEGYKSQNELLVYIKNLFPDLEIITNNYKTLKGLQLDIYIPSLKLAFEYQGYQHYVFPNFYHKSIEEFEALQFRDRRKKELCKEKNIILIEISCFEKLSEQLVIKKLNEINIKTNQEALDEINN